ncbi:MAG: hypothetical protein JNM56_32935 [Planctomycetia bacterium]|nr:hypothetical protein [Planctomycetia bacterium]
MAANQPDLRDLMARYLLQRGEAQAAGLVVADTQGEVTPYEAAPVQAVEPRLAWEEAIAALQSFVSAPAKLQAPPDWPQLVASQEPAVALAFAAGNFPQLVRHVQPLLHAAKLPELRPMSAGRPLPVPALLTWVAEVGAKQQYPQFILGLGALRLARQFDQAEALLRKHRADVPAEWQAALANEEAALAWHQGQAEAALKLWQAQSDSVPVLFNRGMASLFLGKTTAARAALNQAVAKLPESSAWHHLGRLYLALAQMRN